MRGVAQFTVYISKSQVKSVCKCLLLNLFYAVNVYIGGIRWLIFLFLQSLCCLSPEHEASSNIQLDYLFQIFLYAERNCVMLWVALHL